MLFAFLYLLLRRLVRLIAGSSNDLGRDIEQARWSTSISLGGGRFTATTPAAFPLILLVAGLSRRGLTSTYVNDGPAHLARLSIRASLESATI